MTLARVVVATVLLVSAACAREAPVVVTDTTRIASTQRAVAPAHAVEVPVVPADLSGPAIDSIPLDSCARLDSASRSQNPAPQPGEAEPPPAPGSWTETMDASDSLGTLRVPRAATVSHDAPNSSLLVTELPGCRYSCTVSIRYEDDSTGAGLGARIARWRRVEPGGDPDLEEGIPGRPQPIRLGDDRGALMNIPCGDCESAEIAAARGRKIVRIELGIDDREGPSSGAMCRLTRVASTFRWKI